MGGGVPTARLKPHHGAPAGGRGTTATKIMSEAAVMCLPLVAVCGGTSFVWFDGSMHRRQAHVSRVCVSR